MGPQFTHMNVIPFVGYIKVVLTGRVRVINCFFEDTLLIEIKKDAPPATSENFPLMQFYAFALCQSVWLVDFASVLMHIDGF